MMKTIVQSLLLVMTFMMRAYATDLPCTPTTKIDITTIKPRVVIVGEVHGTKEIPEFVGELACSFLQSGKKLILGLEIPSDTQEAINTYMNSPGTPLDKKTLIESEFGAGNDGRRSQAMLALVENMRKLRAAGGQVAVMGFDISMKNHLPPKLYPEEEPDYALLKMERDKTMARIIESKSRIYPEHIILALTGAVHAYKKKGAPWDANYEAMAYVLSQKVPTYIIGMSASGGNAWFCPTLDANGKAQCGSYPTGVRLELEYRLKNGAFDVIDSWVKLGETTASRPMRE
ncbi:MAG: hypothetical protein K1X48_11615 [Burkholderiaceae bacterium]|nr:hypothetical protein [Burkholderiaceae bacterium]